MKSPMLRHSTILLGSLAIATAAALAGGPGSHAPELTYSVTIENLALTQAMSPPVLATHLPPVAMFRVGSLASPGLEALAEDGNQGPMFMRFDGLAQASEAVDVGRPLAPSGQTVMDFTDSATVTIRARPYDRLSLATMLICTNDGFTGLDRARLPTSGSAVFLTSGYDAGTEDNTEVSMDIVDPCSGLGPVALDGDPNGNLDAPVDTEPAEPIRHHPGILEVGDLLATHGWTDPVARITVTRIDEHARDFLARLSGDAEVPPVDSAARGAARLDLDDHGRTMELRYRLRVNHLAGAVGAHIHLGPPDENGPVVASLFGPQDPVGVSSGMLATGRIGEDDLQGPLEGDFEALVEALRAGELYVNVHTADNPGGEIRGQIGAAGSAVGTGGGRPGNERNGNAHDRDHRGR